MNMKFKFIYLKSENVAVVKEWREEGESEGVTHGRSDKIITPNNIKEENPQILIYSEDLKLEEFNSYLELESKFYAIISSAKVPMTLEEFPNLKSEQAYEILNNFYNKWILSNNLQTIEEIFPIQSHLKGLLLKDYSGLFEELWFILKRNLGTSSLRIIFHDIHDMEKGKLSHSFIDGERLPRPQSGGEIEKNLMQMYAHHFNRPFQVCQFEEHTGKFVATAHIRQSPILIMANLYFFNKLQLSVISSLFEGLQMV